jgi:hypothetical protein
MHHESKKATHTAERRTRTALSPYLVDDTTFTLSELRKARGYDTEGAR